MKYITSAYDYMKAHWQTIVKVILVCLFLFLAYRGFLAVKQDYENFKDEIRAKTAQTNTIVQQPTIIQGETTTVSV